ncbi:MAG: ABC transporter permease [Lachnospiraceae bacterium]|nr:ABC transporter permease [Lachnospiraceae bacterium]
MKIKEFFKKNPYTDILLVFMTLVLLIFTITKGKTFWQIGTWKGIVMQFPEFGVMVVGTMFCFLLGCIDMSFVMLGNFATIMGVRYITSHATAEMSNGQVVGVILVAFLIVCLIGAFGGVINGLLISKLGIPPVIATIAMQMVWLGLSTGITNGETLSLKNVPLYAEIGHSMIFGFLPFPLLIFIIIFVIAYLVLRFTTYGRKLYMCGTNRKAARFSAINTDRMIIGTFVLADVICCIGSMLMVSTLNSAKADSGESYVMKIILILVLAGILPDGGIGKMGNLIFSILIIQIITSGVNMFSNLNTYHGSFIYGGLLIIVLILSTFLSGDRLQKLFKPKQKAAG